MSEAEWDRRIRRANELTSFYPYATEGLRFYARVAGFQKLLYADVRDAAKSSEKSAEVLSLRDEPDLFLLLPKFSGFLSLIQEISPPPLASAAQELAQGGSATWQRAISGFWWDRGGENNDAQEMTPQEGLLAWIFLQPYAEALADMREPERVDGTPSKCPVCGSNPTVGALRREGDGAKKSLICMLCAHEWAFRRIYCPSCGEEREPHMGVYSAPEIAHVRVDVCDTCKTYLKSVDLTKMGLAVPVVDDLATIPLDLWAREHGYRKLQTNLLGT
ncbi:MAG TPA: formate dehydrogenase accessory protein FdhE [Candidatus Acidoferrum sp.]|nr:formate dehydrogenase accessory protein FdhE [Candidatus Acidoferrum sp.]